MSKPLIGTIATRSHLAFARVLAGSFHRHHPDGNCYVLLVDGEVAAGFPPNTILLPLRSIGLPNPAAFCFQYDAFALCNALKPFLIAHLQRLNPESPLVFLDADTFVVGNLSPLLEAASTHQIAITPHVTVPHQPGQHEEVSALMRYGTFNAGVLGIGPGPDADAFLAWWKWQLIHHCVDLPGQGLCYDQKYLDLVPSMFPGACLFRHSGFNVGYFNLFSRPVTRTESGWLAGSDPLVVFHFTKFDPSQLRFTSHTGNQFLEEGSLRELMREYAVELRQAGFNPGSPSAYGFYSHADGTPVSRELREEFRTEYMSDPDIPDPFSDPRWLARELELLKIKQQSEKRARLRGKLGRFARAFWRGRKNQ